MSQAARRVLVVDDEQSVTDAMAIILGENGYEVKMAASARECGAPFHKKPFDLVFVELRLPDASGIDLIGSIKRETPNAEVILMTAHGSLDVAIEAIKRGAYYYIEKPFGPSQLVALAEKALHKEGSASDAECVEPPGGLQTYGMIGRSPRMLQIYETIAATAGSDASVLIEGESGAGKELVATALHANSPRAAGEFIHINCAAIPAELIESELFGYRRGAFTGADRDKRGLIEAASGGALLLDEITEMPMHLQAKLLRLLQERKLRRLGDEQERSVDFRLISATNRSTEQAINAGLLRDDLYFRISTIKIRVPPLRERLGDLALLASHFLKRYAAKYQRRVTGISEPAIRLLSCYGWPGNVRELEAVIESSVLFCQGGELRAENLPEHISLRQTSTSRCQFPPSLSLEEIEREAIQTTLERTGGNVKKAAQILQVHRPTFYRKLRKLGVKPDHH